MTTDLTAEQIDELVPSEWLSHHGLWAGLSSYDDAAKAWLAVSGHYLENPPAGALFAVRVAPLVDGLFGPAPSLAFLGLAVVGRPVARSLPQDGTWGELTRFALDSSLPKGTASRVLRIVCDRFADRAHATKLISYHDRSRHTGCIYRKAGFKKDGVTRAGTRRGSWGSRAGRDRAVAAEATSKRRWAWLVPTKDES